MNKNPAKKPRSKPNAGREALRALADEETDPALAAWLRALADGEQKRKRKKPRYPDTSSAALSRHEVTRKTEATD